MNPLVIDLPDPAAAAPVAAADPAVAAVPASPNVAGVPVSTQGIFPPGGVDWFDWFLQQPENRDENILIGEKLVVISLFLPGNHLLVSSAMMSRPQYPIGASGSLCHFRWWYLLETTTTMTTTIKQMADRCELYYRTIQSLDRTFSLY